MLNLVAKIYRTLLPESLRYKILEARKAGKLEKQKQEILRYYDTLPKNQLTPEIEEVLSYLRKNPLHVFPYDFQKKYNPRSVDVGTGESGLKYVLHEGKKIYFKRSWPANRIQDSYSFLMCEQHMDSPHRYLTSDFNIEDNSVVVDVGAAEGIFALSLIEKIKHLYLFETDEEWIEALQETYKPWAGKVTIINKFVSNKNDQQHVSIDAYFKDKKKVDFLKVDVDGAESDLLEGAQQLLSGKDHLQLALCTYHRQQDEQVFGKLLRSCNFTVSPSKGYMLFFYEDFVAPYLRRGLLRTSK